MRNGKVASDKYFFHFKMSYRQALTYFTTSMKLNELNAVCVSEEIKTQFNLDDMQIFYFVVHASA